MSVAVALPTDNLQRSEKSAASTQWQENRLSHPRGGGSDESTASKIRCRGTKLVSVLRKNIGVPEGLAFTLSSPDVKSVLPSPPITPTRGNAINRSLRRVIPSFFRATQATTASPSANSIPAQDTQVTTPVSVVHRDPQLTPPASQNTSTAMPRHGNHMRSHRETGPRTRAGQVARGRISQHSRTMHRTSARTPHGHKLRSHHSTDSKRRTTHAASAQTVQPTASTPQTSASSNEHQDSIRTVIDDNHTECESDLGAELNETHDHVDRRNGTRHGVFQDIQPTILTQTRASIAKTYFNAHFDRIRLGKDLSAREMRVKRFEDEFALLKQHWKGESLEAVQEEFFDQESNHLRKLRVLKSQTNRMGAHALNPYKNIAQFKYIPQKKLGKGSFGAVRLVRKRYEESDPPSEQRVYALKCISKKEMVWQDQEAHVHAEVDFLQKSENSRWAVPLVESFQDYNHLYLVMEYMPGGDFLGHLLRHSVLSEEATRFYVAEMIAGVEEAHGLGFIHRDLKPDNFLIAADGHIKIADFGLAFDGHYTHDKAYYNAGRFSLVHKLGLGVNGDDQDQHDLGRSATLDNMATSVAAAIEKHEPKDGLSMTQQLEWHERHGRRFDAKSGVGTSQYMAPEVVLGEAYDGRCDWWSIGIILYECVYRTTPFQSRTRPQTKQNILAHKKTLKYPSHTTISPLCKQLIDGLLTDKSKRLSSRRYRSKDRTRAYLQAQGSALSAADRAEMEYQADQFVFEKDAHDIRMHEWFEGIDWQRLHEMQPPFVPNLLTADDTQYFKEDGNISYWSETEDDEDDEHNKDNEDGLDLDRWIPTNIAHHDSGPEMPSYCYGTVVTPSNHGYRFPDSDLSPLSPPFVPQSTYPEPPGTQPRSAREAKLQEREAALTRHLSPFQAKFQNYLRDWLQLPYDNPRLQVLEATIDNYLFSELNEDQCEKLKNIARVFGHKARKRPRDIILRDSMHQRVALRERMRLSFLDYAWVRSRKLENGPCPTISAVYRDSLPGTFDGLDFEVQEKTR